MNGTSNGGPSSTGGAAVQGAQPHASSGGISSTSAPEGARSISSQDVQAGQLKDTKRALLGANRALSDAHQRLKAAAEQLPEEARSSVQELLDQAALDLAAAKPAFGGEGAMPRA